MSAQLSVIVTGAREYTRREMVWGTLDGLGPELVIQGGARGADLFADEWAQRNERDCHTFRARWRAGSKYGGVDYLAGRKRNERMLKAYPGTLVLAFVYGQSRGTRNCISLACEQGHRVIVRDQDGIVAEYEGGEMQYGGFDWRVPL